MRRCPKPIVAVVRGYAIVGGHMLHIYAGLTLLREDDMFGHIGPCMRSTDAGYGSIHLVRMVVQERSHETWFLC